MTERPIIHMMSCVIADATGGRKLCRMLNTYAAFRAYPNSIPREVKRTIIRGIQRGRLQFYFVMAVLGGFAIVLPLVLMAPILIGTRFGFVSTMVIAVFVGIPLAWLFQDVVILRHLVRPLYRERHMAWLLRMRRCPWCLYSLEGARRGEADCITCSECGGVWACAGAADA